MQIPILNGIFTDQGPDFRTSYPVNYVPVPKQNGISEGYLRPAPGIVEQVEPPGIDRGGVNWRAVAALAIAVAFTAAGLSETAYAGYRGVNGTPTVV